MEFKNRTREHMLAWFKKKAEMKRFKDLPNKSRMALAKRYEDEQQAARDAKAKNPLNQPFDKSKVDYEAIKRDIRNRLKGHKD